MIVSCIDNWQATDFLKKIITNIYSSFVLAEVLTSFRDHFAFFCTSTIHHWICISWLDSVCLTAEYLDSFHSSSNFLKHSFCTDCHETEIIYHRRRHHNLLSSHILETWKKTMSRTLCSARSTKTSKLIEMINFHDDEYEFLNVRWWRIMSQFLINSEHFSIFDLAEFMNASSFTLSIYFSFDLTSSCI